MWCAIGSLAMTSTPRAWCWSMRGGRLRRAGLLVGLQNTEARERSSICSAALDALDAYTGDAALAAAASDPNFDADRFVAGEDTVYIHARRRRPGARGPP